MLNAGLFETDGLMVAVGLLQAFENHLARPAAIDAARSQRSANSNRLASAGSYSRSRVGLTATRTAFPSPASICKAR